MSQKIQKDVIKQLEGIKREFDIITANMTILNNYFETFIEFYKDEKNIK